MARSRQAIHDGLPKAYKERAMVEIRAIEGGRFAVYAADRHYEVFEGSLGAIAVAHALAAEIAMETHAPVTIATPWGSRSVCEPL